MTDESPKIKRQPASTNIWYNLATIAGDAHSIVESRTIEANRRYWNGWWKEHTDPDVIADLRHSNGELVALPDLTDIDRTFIRSTLAERGFDPEEASVCPDLLELQELEFPTVSFKGFIWPGAADFDNAAFFGGADFRDAAFSGDADFCNVAFSGIAHFRDAAFSRNADFRDAAFSWYADFRGAAFSRYANFRDATFYRFANFCNAAFCGNANFRGAAISGNAHFRDAAFAGYADLSDVTFSMDADFGNVSFSMEAIFGESAFSRGAFFNNIAFSGRTVFSQADFKVNPPALFEAKVHQDTDWHDVSLPSTPADEGAAVYHARCYEHLSLIMKNLNKPHDEHMFFRAGMRARRVTEKHWLARAVNRAYELSCDYGHGVGRATGNLVGLIGVGWILLFLTAFRDVLNDAKLGEGWHFSQDWGLFFLDLFSALAVSVSNCVSLIGLHRGALQHVYARFNDPNAPATFWFDLIWGVQSVLGLIAIFFLLLTLRNRFKMH